MRLEKHDIDSVADGLLGMGVLNFCYEIQTNEKYETMVFLIGWYSPDHLRIIYLQLIKLSKEIVKNNLDIHC